MCLTFHKENMRVLGDFKSLEMYVQCTKWKEKLFVKPWHQVSVEWGGGGGGGGTQGG